MFRAIDHKRRVSIVILDRKWTGAALEALREAGVRNHLLCRVCQGPVLAKAGVIKRPHFAHQKVAHCPLQRESVETLEARGLLYE